MLTLSWHPGLGLTHPTSKKKKSVLTYLGYCMGIGTPPAVGSTLLVTANFFVNSRTYRFISFLNPQTEESKRCGEKKKQTDSRSEIDFVSDLNKLTNVICL
jgi:hypothetical protein